MDLAEMASKAVIAMAAQNVFPSGNLFVLKNPIDQFVDYPVTNHKPKNTQALSPSEMSGPNPKPATQSAKVDHSGAIIKRR